MDKNGQTIKDAIKRQLRTKKVTYQELAEHLQCSLPTIKRILTNEELTLSRLIEILDFLDLSLADLHLLTKQTKTNEDGYTEEQENFLVKNPHFFSYLLHIYDGKSPKQIAEENQLNQRSTDKYLIGLERMDFIRVTGKQKIVPKMRGPNLKSGPLAKAYLEMIIRKSSDLFIKMINDVIFSLDSKSANKVPKKFVYQSHQSTQETYMRWMNEQEKSLSDFLSSAEYEQKTKDPSELKTTVIIQGASLVANDYPGLKTMENLFGKIIPL